MLAGSNVTARSMSERPLASPRAVEPNSDKLTAPSAFNSACRLRSVAMIASRSMGGNLSHAKFRRNVLAAGCTQPGLTRRAPGAAVEALLPSVPQPSSRKRRALSGTAQGSGVRGRSRVCAAAFHAAARAGRRRPGCGVSRASALRRALAENRDLIVLDAERELAGFQGKRLLAEKLPPPAFSAGTSGSSY